MQLAPNLSKVEKLATNPLGIMMRFLNKKRSSRDTLQELKHLKQIFLNTKKN
jgi:hypothetical protein